MSRFANRFRRRPVDAAAPPPKPAQPEGMLRTDELADLRAACETGLADQRDVARLLDHVAASDRLLGLLLAGIRAAELARIQAFRARRDVIRTERTTPSQSIKDLHAIIDQPDGAIAAAALRRLQARALRDAGMATIMDGLPDADRFRVWLKERARRLEKGESHA